MKCTFILNNQRSLIRSYGIEFVDNWCLACFCVLVSVCLNFVEIIWIFVFFILLNYKKKRKKKRRIWFGIFLVNMLKHQTKVSVLCFSFCYYYSLFKYFPFRISLLQLWWTLLTKVQMWSRKISEEHSMIDCLFTIV